MKHLVTAAAAAAMLFVTAAASAQAPAQGQAAAAPTTAPGANAKTYRMAVVDISQIFKNHARFRAAMDQMKAEMDEVEKQLSQKKMGIGQGIERLKTLNPGSPDYKQLDEQLSKQKAEFAVEMERHQKDFMEREAKEYYATFQEVDTMIASYAKHYQIGLVLRHSSVEPDPNHREEILQAINKMVVFQNQIDITDEILAALNRAAKPQAPVSSAQRPATGAAPR